ncbi:MAG: XTP/dITP diphosphohydrolase [Gammaproteobacteria bacterium]|jgi:XTP/dITP diphosphohydrolase
MDEFVLASGNRGKLEEIAELLVHLPVVLSAQSDYSVPEADENGLTFVENALIKARNAARHTNKPSLADDSGIAVSALDGAPGIFSARYAGVGATDAQNVEKLLRNTHHLTAAKRACCFICVAAFVRHEFDPIPVICQGIWRGQLLDTPQGLQGFGYDPIFLPDGLDRSAAELEPQLKNSISHRALAFRKLVAELEVEINAPVAT